MASSSERSTGRWTFWFPPLLFTTVYLGAVLIPAFFLAGELEQTETPAQRGFRLLTTKPYLTPDFDQGVFDELYTCWDRPSREAAAKASPAERRALTLARYGLTEHPDGPRATALQYTPAPDGGWTMNCLACHTGRVAGKVVYGAPNTQYLLQTLTEDVRAVKFAQGKKFTHMDKGSLVFPLGGSIGTTNAVMFGHILLAYRDPDLTFHADRPLPKLTHHDDDAIPWWHYKYKTRLYVDNFAPKNHRALMQFLLIPRNGPSQFTAWEPDYQLIQAWITSLEAPQYPFAIDRGLAAQGAKLFEKNCANCHGRYRSPREGEAPVEPPPSAQRQVRGSANSYPTHSTLVSFPEKIVPIEEVGTDRLRLDAMTSEQRRRFGTTWFAHFGRDEVRDDPGGYLAPPLEGVWASAPYFHNGSVPTLWNVLDSPSRPTVWRRTLDGYDQEKVGLEISRFTELPSETKSDYRGKRLYFDTRLPGKSAQGHTFPDALNREEKLALLEYLKTL